MMAGIKGDVVSLPACFRHAFPVNGLMSMFGTESD